MNDQAFTGAPTYETVWATLQETSKLQKENERLLKEQFAEIRQIFKEAEKARKESDARAEKAHKESDARTEKLKEEFWKTHKAMQKELGGVSNSNGAVAESYFINSFSNSMSFAGQEYDAYDSNLKRKIKKLNLQGEYDLVLYNCNSIVIIEIKYKADKDNVEDLLQKAPIFKQLFPQYANYDIYLGLAALHIDSLTERESLKQGIAVIKQVGDAMVINDAHLKVF